MNGYFRQEGLDDGVPFGFVDVGWTGRIQRSFSRLLGIAGFYPESGVCGFYFALEQRVKPFQNDRLLAYFYDVDKPCERWVCLRRKSQVSELTVCNITYRGRQINGNTYTGQKGT